MNVRYRVELSQAERDELTAMLGGGKHAARKLKRAQILLAADPCSCDAELASLMAACSRISPATPHRGRTLATLIGLLASTGLRSGEALRLDRVDVDLAGGY